jgi:PEP-CTERM motif-containing protein
LTVADLWYDFDDAEPIPEPATIVLVGAGAAAMAARRWRSRF